MDSRQLNQEQIRSHLNGGNVGKEQLNIQLPNSASSTNDVAKGQFQKNPNKLNVVATNTQTAGRGRQGRDFYSNLTHGLYFSIAISPNTNDLESIPLYTILAAATIVEVLEDKLESPLSIKWVNDIFYRGRKVSGILSELISYQKQKGIVIGIGINFAGNFVDADKDTQEVAGTLFGEKLPETFNQNEFLGQYLRHFYDYHQAFQGKAFMNVYEKHLMGIGKKVNYLVNNEPHEGTIQGINKKGQLLVMNSNHSIETLYGQSIHFSSKQFMNTFN